MLAMASQKRPALFRPNSGVPAAARHEEPAVGDVDLNSQSSGVSYSTVAGRKRHLSESENLQLLKRPVPIFVSPSSSAQSQSPEVTVSFGFPLTLSPLGLFLRF